MSELSKFLGLDNHPQTLKAINSVIDSVGETAATTLLPGALGSFVAGAIENTAAHVVSTNTTSTTDAATGVTTVTPTITAAEASATVVASYNRVLAWAVKEYEAHVGATEPVLVGIAQSIGDLVIPLVVADEYSKYAGPIDEAIKLVEAV